jgi:hypothetical protein
MFCQECNLECTDDLVLLCDHIQLSIEEGVPIRWDLVQDLLFPEAQIDTIHCQDDDQEADIDECEEECVDYYEGVVDHDSSIEYTSLEGSVSLAGSDDMESLPEMCAPPTRPGSAHSMRSYYGSDHAGRSYFDLSLHGRSVAESTVTCSIMDADSVDAMFDISYRSWLSSSDRR